MDFQWWKNISKVIFTGDFSDSPFCVQQNDLIRFGKRGVSRVSERLGTSTPLQVSTLLF